MLSLHLGKGKIKLSTTVHREPISSPFSNPSAAHCSAVRTSFPAITACTDLQPFSKPGHPPLLQPKALIFLPSLRTSETLHYINVVQASGISVEQCGWCLQDTCMAGRLSPEVMKWQSEERWEGELLFPQWWPLCSGREERHIFLMESKLHTKIGC